jgi:hypothetical protein
MKQGASSGSMDFATHTFDCNVLIKHKRGVLCKEMDPQAYDAVLACLNYRYGERIFHKQKAADLVSVADTVRNGGTAFGVNGPQPYSGYSSSLHVSQSLSFIRSSVYAPDAQRVHMNLPLKDAAGSILPVFHDLLGLLGKQFLPSLVQFIQLPGFLFAVDSDIKDSV